MKSFNNYIVNTDILRANAVNIKNKIGKERLFCAVVKANAYGIGLHTVCDAVKCIADFFACACIKEALEIRTFDKSTKILILGRLDSSMLECVSKNNISISVGSLLQLQEIDELINTPLNIHLQVNSGLNRFGFKTITEFKKAISIIENNKYMTLEGVYTHFATKQNDKEFINRQYLRFLQFKNYIKKNGVIFHIANSYAILSSNKYCLDMVRSGFLMYGYTENDIGNYPVVSITSKVIDIQTVKNGETIGYDRTYKVTRNMRVGIVPVGYADGLSRNLSNKFFVLINGKKYPIVGLICMDVFMVDLGKDDINVGDAVVLLGKSKGEELKLQDYATILNTSPYEVLCSFNYKRMNYIVKQNKNTKK